MAKTWKQRLVKESAKLNTKIVELDSYISGNHGEFSELKEPDRDLLMVQHATMAAYSNVLEMRMKRYKLSPLEDECDECEEKREEINDMFKEIFENISIKLDEIEKEEDGRNS